MDNEKVYIFGHQKPDTDSVCSAISLAYLKRKMGVNATPRILGSINKETKYVLEYFKVKTPKYLNDVKTQIRDINYLEDYFVKSDSSILKTYKKMSKNNTSGIPVVDDNNKLIGLVTLNDITKFLLNRKKVLSTSFNNLLEILEGKSLLKIDEEIEGSIISFVSSKIPLGNINIDNNTILITSFDNLLINYAIHSRVKLIILTDNSNIDSNTLEKAKRNNVNIISTKLDMFTISNLIYFTNYISKITKKEDVISFNKYTYLSDFNIINNKFKHNNYPIINKDKTCIGMIKTDDVNNKTKKKVILVDHNLKDQSVVGLDEAEIIEVIDHHNLSGNLSTSSPINYRNMVVGSTCTIIYNIFLENNIEIPKYIAGLILSGILSDTLILKSPTTTEIDKKAVKNLGRELNINYLEYGLNMFKAGSSLENKKIEDIIREDFKNYLIGKNMIGISQVFTTDFNYIKKDLNSYIDALDSITSNKEYLFTVLFVTDIIKNGSYIIYSNGARKYLEECFDIENLKQTHFFEKLVSRKKQLLPPILDTLNSN